MKPTNGKEPKTERELRVEYRNGQIDNFPRTAKQMRWDHNNPDFCADWDIVAAEYWSKKHAK